MAENTTFPGNGTYKLKEVRVRLQEGKGLYSEHPVSTAGDALDLMRREMAGYDREVLCVVNLNNRMQPINFHVVSIGDLATSIAPISNILKTGILSNAGSFILLHNHPSGDVTPSGLDILTTRRVIEAGKLLGIPCADHIIVGGSNGIYFSMREQKTVDFDEENITMTAEEILRVGEYEKKEERSSMAERDYASPKESPYSSESFDPEKAAGAKDGQPYPDRKDRLKEITDQLEAGVKEYMATDVQFRKVLETMAKFHHYSANNVLLIAMQMPNATRVASYTSWKRRFNRQVMRGQKGLSIIAPAPYKDRRQREVVDSRTGQPVLDADGKPRTEEVIVTIPRYKVEKVFDVSQTTGDPLPELDVPELTGDAENFKDFMDALTAISPVPIRFADIEGGAKGYYHTVDKEIVIQQGMSESQTLKTLVHEVSHARLHDRDAMKAEGVMKSQQQKELEAESIAYTVLCHYHLDTSGYSIPYLAGWSGSQDTKQLRACMDTIRRTASEIIDEVDAFMAERMKERDVDRVTVYQIREGSPAAAYEFMGMEYVKKQGMEINPEHFQKVYEGKIAPEDTLEDLFIRFNGDRLPEDYTGHSLSVSDIVVIHRDGEDKAYYVDRFGYTEVPEFLAPAQEAVRSGHEEAGRSDDTQVKMETAAPRDPFQETKQPERPEEKLTFYVAECMEFPVMGEYHDGLSLIEALKLYQEMPDAQSGKGIGVTLRDGSEFAGEFALVAAGRVQEDVINGVEHYRLDPDIQAAIAEAKTYIPGSVPERGTDERTAEAKPEKVPERAAEPSRKEERSGSKKEISPKKESVLAELKETQKKLQNKGKEKAKASATRRKKGEQAL